MLLSNNFFLNEFKMNLVKVFIYLLNWKTSLKKTKFEFEKFPVTYAVQYSAKSFGAIDTQKIRPCDRCGYRYCKNSKVFSSVSKIFYLHLNL